MDAMPRPDRMQVSCHSVSYKARIQLEPAADQFCHKR
jgi:hypothetical protein